MNGHARRIKKIAAAAFFYAACQAFLNTPLHAQDARANIRFVKPLVLADYSQATAFTNLGGMSGGDENNPGTLHVTVEHDDGLVLGNAGYALGIDYDVRNLGEYTFYWIKLGKERQGTSGVTDTLDLKKYNYLSFWIRDGGNTGNIKIEVHQDSDSDGVFNYGKDLTSFVYMNAYVKGGAVQKEWSKVIIPLKFFSTITDWSKAHELVFVFENKTGNTQGVVYIDEIIFGNRPDDVLFAADDAVIPVKEPDAASFRVDDAEVKDCLLFKGTN